MLVVNNATVLTFIYPNSIYYRYKLEQIYDESSHFEINSLWLLDLISRLEKQKNWCHLMLESWSPLRFQIMVWFLSIWQTGMYLNGELSKLGSDLTDNCHSLTPPPPQTTTKTIAQNTFNIITFHSCMGPVEKQIYTSKPSSYSYNFPIKKGFHISNVNLWTCVIPTAWRSFFEEITFNSQF